MAEKATRKGPDPEEIKESVRSFLTRLITREPETLPAIRANIPSREPKPHMLDHYTWTKIHEDEERRIASERNPLEKLLSLPDQDSSGLEGIREAAGTVLATILSSPNLRENDLALSPLVTDTLSSLAGGKFLIREQPSWLRADRSTASPFLGVSLEPNADRRTLSHETGHIVDYRNSLPDFDRIADANFDAYKEAYPDDYGSKSKAEYKAVLFSDAFDIIQHSQKQGDPLDYIDSFITEWEKVKPYPGLQEMVYVMLNQPIFEGHPARKEIQERGLELATRLTRAESSTKKGRSFGQTQ